MQVRYFKLGSSAIYCHGDSTDADTINTLRKYAGEYLGAHEAEIVITDPPYGVALTAGKESKGEHERSIYRYFFRQHRIINDELEGDELKSLWVDAIINGMGLMFCSRLLMFFANSKTREVLDCIDELKLPLRSFLFWMKDQQIVSWSEFCPQTEMIVYAGYSDSRRRNKNRGMSNVFYAKHSQISTLCPWKHPSSKPIKLIRDLLDATTIVGDLVYDPFAGTGSTMVACYRTGRKSVNIDMSERFVFGALLRFRFETAKQIDIHEITPEGLKLITDSELQAMFDAACAKEQEQTAEKPAKGRRKTSPAP